MIDVESSVLIKPSKRNQQFCDKVDLPSSYDECRITTYNAGSANVQTFTKLAKSQNTGAKINFLSRNYQEFDV